jgi:hypothetical protein
MTTTTDAARSGQPGTATPGNGIPGFVTMLTPGDQTPVHAIASTLVGLLTEHPDLPGPDLVSISRRSREIDLQFPDSPDTFHAMAAWADRFGGTLTGEPCTGKDATRVRCEVRFDCGGVQFKAYAYITTAGTADT